MGSIVILGGNMSHLYEAYVKDLLINSKWHYLIPEYQRGYRWRPEEVELLIDDISGYADEKEYFLNVLILQKNNEDETSYDIVDGQQRLTTLSILEKYCGVKSDSISDLLEKGRRESDKYFIERAKAKAEEIIGKNIEPFKRKLGECRFFVYEIDGSEEDATKVFERINTGKIPLSSAELLKADLVSAVMDRISQKIKASRWQQIEKLLQNDDFYFFICPNRGIRRYQATRMDYALELYFARDNNDNCQYKEKYEKNPIFLYKEIKEKKEAFDFDDFERFVFDFLYMYCYLNITVRNYIGYRLYKKDPDDEFHVFKDLHLSMEKSKDLQSSAKELLLDKQIETLAKGTDDRIIYNLLFLSMVIRYTKEKLPFDFVRYASTEKGWDIEHIHARNQEEYSCDMVELLFDNAKKYQFFEDKKDLSEFIETNLSFYKSGKSEEDMNKFENGITSEVFPEKNGLAYLANLINAAVKKDKQFIKNSSGYYITELPQIEEKKWIDSIGNLVLLPASINRSFGNWPYPLKCEVIKDACEKQYEYIPFCVEEKYDRQCRVEWNIESRNEYIQHLKKLFALEEKNGN